MTKFALLCCTIMFLAACGSSQTRLLDWQADPAAKEVDFSKLLVVVGTANDSNRALAEKAFADALAPFPVVMSHQHLDLGDETLAVDDDAIMSLATAQGCDGIVVMSLVGQGATSTREESVFQLTLGDYWDTHGSIITHHYSQTKQIDTPVLAIETSIYRDNTSRPLWWGLTRTSKPAGVSRIVTDTVEAVRQGLRDQGLIPAAPTQP